MNALTSLVELNDADILRLEGVLRILNTRLGQRLPIEHFVREATERFAEVGFRVDIRTYSTNHEGVYTFEMEIQERLEGAFDPDQMVHEVTNDILNLGEGGVIKTDGGLLLPKSSTHVSHSH